MSGAGDVAGAAGARAHFLDRRVHGGAHRRVLAHAEIVVGAPHRYAASAVLGAMVGGRIGPAAALEVGEDAIAAFLVQRLEILAETGLVIHVSSLDHLNPNRPLPRPGSRGYRCSAANGKLFNPRLTINAGIRGGVQGLSSINRSAVTSAPKPMVERHFCRIPRLSGAPAGAS